MYVAVKGGEAAIANAHRLLADRRRGDRSLPAIGIDQIVAQLGLAVDRVMAEASLFDRTLAALAIRQSRGDMIEAIFLLRAYRTTLPRFGYSRPLDTADMTIERRISRPTRICRAASFLGLPSIIPIGCSIPRCFRTKRSRRLPSVRRRPAASCAYPKFSARKA